MRTDKDEIALPAPAWGMLEFTFSIYDTEATMVALCNDRQIVIRLFAENFSESPSLKEKYLFFVRVADEFELEEYTALVRGKDGRVFGLLLSYIDCQRRTLSCAAKPDMSLSVRRKWAEQVDSVLAELHHNSIAWGDVKPDNVLIDRNNDAWLIDFGASYTEGWVPKELAGNVEGDLVELEKIKNFLGRTAAI